MNVPPLDVQAVLDKVVGLPIREWNFKTATHETHLGPMAQDFYAAFGLGGGDTTITTIDPDGVALAAIQGLNQKLKQKDAEITALRQWLEKLEQHLLLRSHGKSK